jgi:hypothetical protein
MGVRSVNFAVSKDLPVKNTFPRCKIPKYTLTAPDESHTNQIDHALTEDTFQVYLMSDLFQGMTVILANIWFLQKFGIEYQ